MYRLRFNASGNPFTAQVPKVEYPPQKHPTKIQQLFILDQWYDSGFLWVQQEVDSLLLGVPIQSAVASVKLPPYVDDNFAEFVQNSFGLWVVLPLMSLYLRLVYQLLYEKERKLKELQIMMGLSGEVYYLSWAITYGVYMTLISLLSSLLLHLRVFKVYQGWGILGLGYPTNLY